MYVDKSSTKLTNIKQNSIAESNKEISISDVEYEEEDERYILKTGENLIHDKKYELEMKFSSLTGGRGFEKGSYVYAKQNKNKNFSYTHFAPVEARRVFPCMDEPSFKSKFSISVCRPENELSLSNMQRSMLRPR